MHHHLTVKARLYAVAVISLLGLAIFAAIALYSLRSGSRALSMVYEQHVEPMTALVEVDEHLREIRFRMAGYLLDQLPSVGNRNHLREARAAIPRSWQRFQQAGHRDVLSPAQRRLIDEIDTHVAGIDTFFDKLDLAYRQDDKRTIALLLEEHWPYEIHAHVLKPIAKLIPAQKTLVKETYDANLAFGQSIIGLGLLLLATLGAGLLALIAKIIAGVVRPLDMAVTAANRVAAGDCNQGIDAGTTDEFGQLLTALENMQAQVRSRQERLETILDNAAEGIITFDDSGLIEAFNRSAEELFGWSELEVLGQHVSTLIRPSAVDGRDNYFNHIVRSELNRLIGHEGEVIGRHKDGTTFPVALKISDMMLGERRMYVALAADISERKALIENLKHLAEHDGLTGLYNRSYFLEELERIVQRTRRAEQSCGLLYIDLDNFKYINDTLGHAAGDHLLIEIAHMLRRRARNSDLVARLGGDEFTILLYDINETQLIKAAESYRQTLAGYTYRHASESVTCGCSIGAAMVTEQITTAAQLVSCADFACHLAKRQGRNRVHVFQQADAEKVTVMSVDMGWTRRIREAIEHNRFALACQPIVETRSRRVLSYEVLVRMLDERGELIMPAGFLPPAERFGLMVDIDKWVILHAIDTLAAQRKTMTGLCFSINLSGQTLTELSVCDLIHARIAANGLEPSALTFEVTETVAIADMATAEAFLARLKSFGCRTALDDFGSGMSSFGYLQDLPVDYIKIDGRFVRNLAANPVDQAMVRAMNEIAHALGKRTVAEFVENEESFQALAEIGVDYGQGYHLGRPDVIFPCKDIAEHGGNAGLCVR